MAMRLYRLREDALPYPIKITTVPLNMVILPGKRNYKDLTPSWPSQSEKWQLFNGGGGRDIKNEPTSLLLIEYTEAKINLGRGRSCWQQRFLTFEERILFTEWSYKVDQKHSLNSSSNNIKTITINHFPMEGSLVYMKLSEVSLIHIKGTTLYTQKKSAIKLTWEWER